MGKRVIWLGFRLENPVGRSVQFQKSVIIKKNDY